MRDFRRKCMDDRPPNDEKCALYDENAWTIDNQNDEKCAIFDETAWTIDHQNDEKCAIFD